MKAHTEVKTIIIFVKLHKNLAFILSQTTAMPYGFTFTKVIKTKIS